MTLLRICWPTCAQPSSGVSSDFVFTTCITHNRVCGCWLRAATEPLQIIHAAMQPFPLLLPPFYYLEISSILCPVLLHQRPVAKQNSKSPMYIFFFLKVTPGFAFLCDTKATKSTHTKMVYSLFISCSTYFHTLHHINTLNLDGHILLSALLSFNSFGRNSPSFFLRRTRRLLTGLF